MIAKFLETLMLGITVTKNYNFDIFDTTGRQTSLLLSGLNGFKNISH